MTIYEPFDVVEVPFPFTDIPRSKMRKALVLSSRGHNEANQATTLLMITSAHNSQWKGDVSISNWQDVGLRKPCLVRLKFFTADNKLLKNKIGRLSKSDELAVVAALTELFNLKPPRS